MAAMKLVTICSLALLSNSQKFLPVQRDSADALARKLLKNVGLDSEEKKVGVTEQPSHERSSVADHSHSRLSSKDLIGLKPEIEAGIAAGTLTSPKEWVPGYSKQSDESGLSSLKDGVKHMFHDLASPRSSTSAADWGEFQDASSESRKEVVKVFDKDAIIRQPVQVSPLHAESSVPVYVKELRLPASASSSAGLRWFKQPLEAHAVRDEPSTTTVQHDQAMGFMNTTELEAKVDSMREQTEGTDSLAMSLKSQFKSEKKKELERMQRPHLPTGEVNKKAVPEPSAIESVHRGVRGARKMLPIRQEDVHYEESEPEEISESNSTQPLLRLPAKKKIHEPISKAPVKEQKSHETKKNPMQDLFNMYAKEGLVDANGMETVLKELGTKKDWNWHIFDKDSDGKLSIKEFANAMVVAQRFKTQK